MNAEALKKIMSDNDLLDAALIFHSFTPYMRDYELIVRFAGSTDTVSYLFKFCVEANVKTTVRDDAYKKSLDDRLIDYRTGVDLDGYVWGVCWSELYPGWTLVKPSETTRRWTDRIGIDFHEVFIEGDAVSLQLMFSELAVRTLEPRQHWCEHIDPSYSAR